MSYNILGINTSHDGSVCVLVDGKIDFFLEEDRISKKKHDELPLKVLKFISKNYSIDEIAIGGLTHQFFFHKLLDSYLLSLNLLFPKSKISKYLRHHHLSHSFCSFKNSNFKKCLGIVIDGNGSYIEQSNHKYKVETESVFVLDTLNPPYCLYNSSREIDENPTLINSTNESLSLCKVYECVTEGLGFDFIEAGKTMGLSSYGKFNPSIPSLYIGSKGNKEIIESKKNTTSGNIKSKYKYLFNSLNLAQDLAFKVQQESQHAVGNLIEKAIQETGLKQVCCSGGYFLNCVANYYLTKRFPNIEFYFEPISSDAGISIGAAKLAWYDKTQDITIRPQKTLYYGPKYSKKDLLRGIQKYLD